MFFFISSLHLYDLNQIQIQKYTNRKQVVSSVLVRK